MELYMLINMQNDLVHGWGLDFNFWRCVDVSTSTLVFIQMVLLLK